VLYHGRDGGSTFQEKLSFLRGLNESLGVIVSTLLAKLPACAHYFARAQEALPEGLSLQAV
jgi:hypothetical protein